MTAIADIVDRRLSAVEDELRAAAGGASLCAISRSGGGKVPLVKHLEGRMAVLLQLRRHLRRNGPDDAVGAVSLLAGTWQTELAAARQRGVGPDWLAYRSGGVDELEALSRELETVPPETVPPATGA